MYEGNPVDLRMEKTISADGIFDEATSALDQGNENIIQQTIDRLSVQTTCVIIAHRLSTVRKCDRIIWLDKGKIIRQGEAKIVLSAFTESL